MNGELIERLADAAWPAEQCQALGPWTLRASRGVTRRANSVLTLGARGLDRKELAKLIESAERFYAERSLPPVFQLSPMSPAALDRMLEDRGYGISGASEVWTAPCNGGADILVCPEEISGQPSHLALPIRLSTKITLEPSPSQSWFDCAFDEPEERRAIHEELVRRIPSPRAFATVSDGRAAEGVGMAVANVQHGIAGIFCMATRLENRRKGIAAGILSSLSDWAAALRIRKLYLQVMNDNAPARALYARAGFTSAFPYHYRIRYE